MKKKVNIDRTDIARRDEELLFNLRNNRKHFSSEAEGYELNTAFQHRPITNMNKGMNRKRIIAVSSSGKGGTGKSTTSVMLGLKYNELNGNTCLVDFDLPLGDVSTMLRISNERCISDFYGVPDDISDIKIRENLLLTHQTGLRVLPALRDLTDLDKVNTQGFVRKLFSYLKSFDVIVVDTGPNFEAATLEILNLATDVVYVTDDYETSFQNIFQGVCYLKEKNIDIHKFRVVVNRSKNIDEKRLDIIARMTGIPNVFFAPNVKGMSDLVDDNIYIVIDKRKHVYCEAIEGIMKDLTPELFGTKEKRGFFARLFGRAN